MLAYKLRVAKQNLFLNLCKGNSLEVRRNVQVSVTGAAGEIGSNVALLLKMNYKIKHLKLHDDDLKVSGVGLELGHIPGGPLVSTYAGNANLGPSLLGSDIILVTARTSRKPGYTREDMIAANAPAVQNVCRAIVDYNPKAFLAISTNPINCIIPFASALLYKYNCYSPYKVYGITHIDTARSRALTGQTLKVNPRHLHVPVIGGHSDETIIPLFSNLCPNYHTLDESHADTLTRLIRKAGSEVIVQKQGADSSTLAMAWSIHEFIDGLIDAVCGTEVILCCYTANPNYGTRFFSGPTTIGQNGIIQICRDMPMNNYEGCLLNAAVPIINRDVSLGEEYVRYIGTLGNR